jgi:hypothetical protein
MPKLPKTAGIELRSAVALSTQQSAVSTQHSAIEVLVTPKARWESAVLRRAKQIPHG